MIEISRRTALGLLGAVAVPSAVTVAVAAASAPAKTASVDDFLARASASERAHYHAAALTATMAELCPDRSWQTTVDQEGGFALISGKVKGSGSK